LQLGEAERGETWLVYQNEETQLGGSGRVTKSYHQTKLQGQQNEKEETEREGS